MSENLTIVKSRKAFKLDVKEGEYYILVQPDKQYDFHIKAYRKAAETIPVSDEFSRVCIGQLRHTSPVLNFITKAQKVVADEQEQARNDSIEATILSAPERQAKMVQDQKDRIAEYHKARIDKKNAMVDEVRKSTGQPLAADIPKLESKKSETKKPDEKTVRAELFSKTKAELLAVVDGLNAEESRTEKITAKPESKKSEIVNLILLATGYTLTPEELNETTD